MTAAAATLGLVVDQLVGEPSARVHPVARFGSLMQRVEATVYADRRRNGVAFLAVGITVAAATGAVLRQLVGASVATVCATAVCAAGRMLDDEALRVARSVESGDLLTAREDVRSLVGRATSDLDAHELSRAVIESVAENGVDAVTASLFWASVGGAPAVLVHRAVNTLDAMVGHRNTRYGQFGWASARLDDVLNHGPARLMAGAVALARPRRAVAVWRTVRQDAGRHPSPNGGVIEAAFAAALDLRLGGVNRYGDDIEDRGALGAGRTPAPTDILAAVRLRRRATAVSAAALVAAQLGRHARSRRRSR
ncbi:MAG: cobD [Ilumatobacteraceae bacterium]|nr:cobD [Ilumatobacteraceae bacterium]